MYKLLINVIVGLLKAQEITAPLGRNGIRKNMLCTTLQQMLVL